jgi:hypothetical protein
MLNSSDEESGDTRIVLKTSRPAMTACVFCGEMSNEAIASPVRCVTVCDAPGLFSGLILQESACRRLGSLTATSIDPGVNRERRHRTNDHFRLADSAGATLRRKVVQASPERWWPGSLCDFVGEMAEEEAGVEE